ncbi:hypothetical protein Ddye_011442 [Dipteronia dyeriana]|uniref:Uncharacterized protein n=1 Tax=Dipteronia dyeriana TaxID=168575 RepID=A0AAD9X2H8_9ROSI|nr:hypothetical protein Ddye_011442 [Dipteronia dyeriana]
MGKKRMSTRQREGVSKRKKDIQDYQEESNTVENETWHDTGSIDSSEKEKESVKKEELAIDSSEKERETFKKEELDGAGISNGVVVLDAKLDKLSEEMKAMKKELEEKIDAGFKALKDEIDAGFTALREEMAARNDQQRGSIPKSFKAVARYASVPVQAHTPEIEAILKEVTKSTSSEEDNSITKTSSSSDDISSSSSEKNKKEAGSSEEAKDVTFLAPRLRKRQGSANGDLGDAISIAWRGEDLHQCRNLECVVWRVKRKFSIFLCCLGMMRLRMFENRRLDRIVFKVEESCYVPTPLEESPFSPNLEPSVLDMEGGYHVVGWCDMEIEMLTYKGDSEKDDDKDDEADEDGEGDNSNIMRSQ